MGCDLNHIAVCGELNNSVSRVCNSLHMFIAAYFFFEIPEEETIRSPICGTISRPLSLGSSTSVSFDSR